ncbi:hypothetical protein PG996_000009 [Apiospora saccharicola]|uniref:Uncharacterized protein n=1 Tax=Apiospora saccharicola TaxID=335842 RepID=A0ABR1WGK8_9PEZI
MAMDELPDVVENAEVIANPRNITSKTKELAQHQLRLTKNEKLLKTDRLKLAEDHQQAAIE